MHNEDYIREIVVSVSPSIAFQAITHEMVRWWGGSVSGKINQQGDIFTKMFDLTHWWTFRVTHLVPNAAIDMECIEANHVHQGIPASFREEWLGTTLCWRLDEVENGTRIQFTHKGLTQALDCYDTCAVGWDHFFVGSLQRHLNDVSV